MTAPNRKIVFVTGTRADFGKLKPLILQTQEHFDTHVFVTGMHMLSLFGSTYREVEKAGVKNIHKFINQSLNDTMDVMLAKTVQGFSDYTKEEEPGLIIVHGDRVEALAAAIVGSLSNILVGHVEGGELSGTVDGAIRHSISKLSHVHFACNEDAGQRLRQLGEDASQIFVIGSPDLDVMCSDDLPTLSEVKSRYQIGFDGYGIAMFHPVTTELKTIRRQAATFVEAMNRSAENVVFIYPNNDLGSREILDVYSSFPQLDRFRFFPSVRFEHFLTLLKNARFIAGNSSAGVREAPFYGIPSVDVGTRQAGRVNKMESVEHVPVEAEAITAAVKRLAGRKFEPDQYFGTGNSTENFLSALQQDVLWNTDCQKSFFDLDNV